MFFHPNPYHPIPDTSTASPNLTFLRPIILLFLILTLCTLFSHNAPKPQVHVRREAVCANDYASCGAALLSPVTHLSCCNPSFYCYNHGPYFTQCRPKSEMAHRSLPRRAVNVSNAVCAPDYRLCNPQLDDAYNKYACCGGAYLCRPANVYSWLCLPKGDIWYWVSVSTDLEKQVRKVFGSDLKNGIPVLVRDKIQYRYNSSHASLGMRILFAPTRDSAGGVSQALRNNTRHDPKSLRLSRGVARLNVLNITDEADIMGFMQTVAGLRWVSGVEMEHVLRLQ